MNKFSRAIFTCLTVTLMVACSPKSPVSVQTRVCEYEVNPLGIDTDAPRFSWTLTARKNDQVQSAYEIIVSDNLKDIRANRGNVWSSGKVDSNQSIQVPFAGQGLQSFTRYYWKVKVHDANGKASPWSKVAWFETAMMNESEWKAKWISDGSTTPERDADFYRDDPAPLFRKQFVISKKVASARLYITGLGYYEPYLNGQKVGDQVLDPGWTTYGKQVLYATYDVTNMLREGDNAIGIMAGNGWYNLLPFNMWCSPNRNLRNYLDCGRPTVKAQLRVTYKDGSVDEIYTDGSWQTIPGPILRNNIYLGEVYDARKELPGWSSAGFDAAGMKKATEIEGPKGALKAQMQPRVKTVETIRPTRIYETEPGVYLVDMGVNFAGVVRVHVKGEAGTKISLRYGEDVYPDGTLNGMTAVAGQMKGCYAGEGAPDVAWQEDHYILNGNPKGETWNPRFTFHGFRYVEVKGWPGVPALDDIEGLRLSSDVKSDGEFTCSNPMFNKIQENTLRTFRSNLFSVQSDCPTREKYAYGGDILCTTEAFLFNYNMGNFHRKTVDDHRHAQRPLGGITETAPYVGIEDYGPGDGSGPLGFQLGYSFIIDKLHEFYGDNRVIEENYDALKRQADFLIQHADDHLYHGGLSDHESLDEKPFGLTESLFYYKHVALIAKYAAWMQREEDATYYGALKQQIKEKILQAYHDHETGVFANATQTAQVFGLAHDLLDDAGKEKALSVLEKVLENRDNHISTGIFGTKMMFDVLRENDRNELMYRVANQKDFPGWGYMVEKGATSLWETWTYSDNVYSQNHPMFGSISEWFYRSLLGINAAEPGFKKIIIKPRPAGELTFARGAYNSIHGPIRVDWKRIDGKFTLEVEIPVNTTAEVYTPSSNGYTRSSIGSGKHRFETTY